MALRHRPFDLDTAARHGLTYRALQHARFRRLFGGVYVCADVRMTRSLWFMAARLVLPDDAALAGLSGLHAHDVEIGPARPLRFVTATGRQVRREGLRVRRLRCLPAVVDGSLRVERCWLAACAELDLVDAVAAADRLLHLGHTTAPALGQAVTTLGPVAGTPTARRALHLVRERAESIPESDTRMLLVLTGLPEPQCNVDIYGPHGFIARGDLVYAEARVIVEYDGRQHAENRRQWNRDIDRHEDLQAAGWICVRVTAERLRHPREVVQLVHRVLVARGCIVPAPVFRAEWSAMFEATTFAGRSRTNDHRTAWI